MITDIDGRFTISAGAGQVIEVSFIGFKTYAFPVDSKSEYTVVLQDDAELLEEVVVVGYGFTIEALGDGCHLFRKSPRSLKRPMR